MSKHRYLISKYHWKSRKSFIKLYVDSVFSFLGIGPKTKTWNWRKFFYIMCYRKRDFLKFKKREQRSFSKGVKVLRKYDCFVAWLRSVFCWKMKATIPPLKEVNERKCKKCFCRILILILSA